MVDTDTIIFLKSVREAARKKILFLPHAIRQMNLPERMISTDEVREVVFSGEIVEDYPEDARGHSCLMFVLTQGGKGRPVHAVCAPKDEYLAIITAYIPSLDTWEPDLKTRRR